jgi:hypothetical protein
MVKLQIHTDQAKAILGTTKENHFCNGIARSKKRKIQVTINNDGVLELNLLD